MKSIGLNSSQYSRRENIRVFGVAETADELTNDVIVKVAADMGVVITERDISVSHRIGKNTGSKPRPIIAKFVRRDKDVNGIWEVIRGKDKNG